MVTTGRRQSDLWQRVVLFTNGWGRMDTLGTVTDVTTTSYQPIACRRVNGRYIMLCSNGYIYLSNTGEQWRGIGVTNKSIAAGDINDKNGYVYASEYSLTGYYAKNSEAQDFQNWVVKKQCKAPYNTATFCKTGNDGYTYATVDYLARTYDFDNEVMVINATYCATYKYGDDNPILYLSRSLDSGVIGPGWGAYEYIPTWFSSVVNGKAIQAYSIVVIINGVQTSDTKIIYVDDVLKTAPHATYNIIDCEYIGSNYIVATSGDKIYTTTDFTNYTLVLNHTAKRLRLYDGVVYLCTDGGLFTTTDGVNFTNHDNTRQYYDVVVA